MRLPESVNITEVGPRDGFQSIKEWIPTKLKLEIIESLICSGFKKIEITSFVHPKIIPQMSDAKEIVSYLLKKYESNAPIFNALVPNLFGAKEAHKLGLKDITYVVSASASHNMANVKRSKEESLKELQEIKSQFKELNINFSISTAFGCPYEGKVSLKEVVKMVEKALEMQVSEISLADTIGVANPLQIHETLTLLNKEFKNQKFTLHLHNTRGMALANTLAALECGVLTFESALGGLGGCPFAPGASGNVASEDLINMLHSMGIKTGVNLEKLLETLGSVKEGINPNLSSHLSNINTTCTHKRANK